MGKILNIKRHKTDEKTEAALAVCERYRIVSDGDGHEYIIKVWQTNEFYQWVEWSEDVEYDTPWTGHDFNEDRIDGGVLTFTDPKVG